MTENSRQEQIRAKGFDMISSYRPSEFSNIKVGVKSLDDAILNLGSLKNGDINRVNKAINSNKPALLDVRIDRFENVLPMVPTGGALFNMMLEYKE